MTHDEQFVKERFPGAFEEYRDYDVQIRVACQYGVADLGKGLMAEQAWTAAAERIRREDKNGN